MDIKPGTTHEVSWTVTPERTADAMGNPGVKVFATPFVIGLLEQAAAGMITPHLPAAASTVGTMVEMKHLAATPVGMTVRAKATLIETDGRRFLFAVEAPAGSRGPIMPCAAFSSRPIRKGVANTLTPWLPMASAVRSGVTVHETSCVVPGLMSMARSCIAEAARIASIARAP